MSLRVEKLIARVGEFTVDVPEWKIPSGELHTLMGKSGSGKSTFLNAIAGFIPVERGNVFVDEKNISGLPPEKRKMAMVFQRSSLFPNLDVLQNVAFALRVQGIAKATREQAAREWLEKVELPELANRRSHELSEGQAQRVALARALASRFPVVLLDEPFSALDLSTRRQLRNLIVKLVRETQIAALMVTHHPDDALAISDRILLMDTGSAVGSGTPKELQETQDPKLITLLGLS